MGTSAYLLFTVDKLAVGAAKQLQGAVHEGATGKLVQHWLYAQARIALGVHKAATPVEGESPLRAPLPTLHATTHSPPAFSLPTYPPCS